MEMHGEPSSRDLVYFPLLFNIVALGLIGILYAFLPDIMVEYSQMMFNMYLIVFLTEWILAFSLIRRLKEREVTMSQLAMPKKKIRWLPAAAVFTSLNVLFISYTVLAIWAGRIEPLSGLYPLQITFLVVAAPLAAGIVEELAFRGYLIEESIRSGFSEKKAVLYVAISFALIHGFFVIDRLLVTFVFGLIAGFYYVRERNLPVLIFSHVIVDIVTFSLVIFWPGTSI